MNVRAAQSLILSFELHALAKIWEILCFISEICNWEKQKIESTKQSMCLIVLHQLGFITKLRVVSVKAADPCCVCRASEIVQLRAAICFCYYLILSVASPGEICVGFEFLCNQAVWTFFLGIKQKGLDILWKQVFFFIYLVM